MRYTGSALKDLEIMNFKFTDDISLIMRPIVQHLHKFNLYHIEIEEMFFSNILPNWAAELRELRIERSRGGNFDFLHGPLPNLSKITLGNTANLNANDMNEMLKYNPQLKEILYYRNTCPDECVRNILPSLVEYVPEIESLHLYTG